MKKYVFLVVILIFCKHVLKAQQPYSTFNHISIHVNDLDRSVKFYTDLFKLDSIPDPFPEYRVTWFTLGGKAQFHVFEDKSPIGGQEKYHICFSVASIDEFIGRLKSRGLSFYNGKGREGIITQRSDQVKQIYIRDPDGHRIEINDARF